MWKIRTDNLKVPSALISLNEKKISENTVNNAKGKEGRLERNIEDGGNSGLVGNMASKERRMNNKAEVQLHLLESDGGLMQI